MGANSCQCKENRREDDIEELNDEIIDNTPYEVMSNHKEGITTNQENNQKKYVQQPDNSNNTLQSRIQCINNSNDTEAIKEMLNKNSNSNHINTEKVSYIKETDKFLHQIPDGPPLEIINENNRSNANNTGNNDEENNEDDDDDNDNDINGNEINKDIQNDISNSHSPKLTSKTNSINNTITQEKDNKENNNNNKNTKQNKQLTINQQLMKQKSKGVIYHNTNPNIFTSNDKNFTITQLISNKKLKQLGDNDIVFTGELDKMLNNEDKKAITYSTRFCILTPKHFSYYSSKENFLSLKKPLCQLSLSLISKVDKAAGENKCIYFSIMFKLTNETIKILKNINSFSIMNEEISSNEQGMIGFKSTSEDIISKWVTLLQYFCEKAKE